jgi:tetratricopeptide (TPR) repeat protein
MSLKILLLGLSLLVLMSGAGRAQSPSLDELIKQADLVYAENYVSEARLREAIDLYEQALAIDPKNRHALNRLAQAYHEWAFGYLNILAADRSKTREGQKAAYAKGMEYGFRSLRLNPVFAANERDRFEIAVQAVDDVAALSWVGNNWGRLIEFDQFRDPIGTLQAAAKIKQMYERTLQLDEKYFFGQPRRAYGALLANLPSILGGDLHKAKEHLERAIQIAPDFLETRVVYAREYALRARDKKLAERELKFVLDAPEGEPVMRLWNRIAKREAQDLMGQLGSQP